MFLCVFDGAASGLSDIVSYLISPRSPCVYLFYPVKLAIGTSIHGYSIMRRPAPGAHLVLVVGVAALCWAWLQRVAAVARPGPLVCRSAFSAPECDAIGQAFLARPAEHDVRDDDGIRRTNRWDTSKVRPRLGPNRPTAPARLAGPGSAFAPQTRALSRSEASARPRG